uniref:Reverse transcriptase zinc-binding domain-containing protein n=1 Tax=Manihot esculenta TaxID=3983 RepID=A0A2C9WGV5_MANES
MPGSSSQFVRNFSFWTDLWKLLIAPKFFNFLWKACNNVLATRVNLFSRKCSPSPSCPLCNQAEEMIEPLFFLCHHTCTRATWFGSRLEFSQNLQKVGPFHDWVLVTLNQVKQGDLEMVLLFYYICWHVLEIQKFCYFL